MLYASPWEICHFLKEDGEGVDWEGVDGNREGTGGQEGGETGWNVKYMKEILFKEKQ